MGDKLEFKPAPVDYVAYHKYLPDFRCDNLLVEAKGFFQDSSEMAKYLHIRNSCREKDIDLLFVFEDPEKPLHWRKAKADGTKMTMAQWATKHGFNWTTEEGLKDAIRQHEDSRNTRRTGEAGSPSTPHSQPELRDSGEET